MQVINEKGHITRALKVVHEEADSTSELEFVHETADATGELETVVTENSGTSCSHVEANLYKAIL